MFFQNKAKKFIRSISFGLITVTLCGITAPTFAMPVNKDAALILVDVLSNSDYLSQPTPINYKVTPTKDSKKEFFDAHTGVKMSKFLRDIDVAFETMENRISPYGSVGCVDTVCATGAYYNRDLLEAYQQGITRVPDLRRNLESKGYVTEEFDGYANKGDLLIYGNDDHVVIADGYGGCFGNSSSRGYAQHYDNAYNAWHTGSAPSKIIRMSAFL